MDNTPFTDDTLSSTDLYPTDALLGSGSADSVPSLRPDTPPGFNSSDTGLSDNPDINSGADFNPGNLFALIPGASSIATLIHVVESIIPDIEKAVGEVGAAHPLRFIQHFLGYLQHTPKFIEFIVNFGWKEMTNLTVGTLYREILYFGMGVDPNKFTSEEDNAVTTVDTMVGFALLMPLIAAGIDVAGKALLANRWSKAMHESIKDLPQEFGLSWALGLVVNRGFEAAIGTIIEEAINKQKRPNRIAWPQVRTMLKQHVIEPDQFNELMVAQGFPDEQIKLLKRLQDVQLTIGDIQQLYFRDRISATDALKSIEALGYDQGTADLLFELYVSKADTQASTALRNIARQMFADHLLSDEQYRAILDKSNFPSKLIDQDIAAVKLEQDVGKVLTSVAVIKSQYQHHLIDAQGAQQALAELNYSAHYIGDLIQSWDATPIRRTHGLSQSKILSYFNAGIIKNDDAYKQLLASGLNDDSANFLIAHPTASPGVHVHSRTPGLVIQAYIDGAVPPSHLEEAFKSAGVKDEDLSWYIDIAHYRLAHKHGGANGTQGLDKSEYVQAFKVGIIDFPTLVSNLQTLGYAPDAALVIAEIANKGPYQAPQAGPFSSLQAAINYMITAGYTVTPPPDPKLQAAESLLAQNGYSWTENPSPGTIIPAGGLPPPPRP